MYVSNIKYKQISPGIFSNSRKSNLLETRAIINHFIQHMKLSTELVSLTNTRHNNKLTFNPPRLFTTHKSISPNVCVEKSLWFLSSPDHPLNEITIRNGSNVFVTSPNTADRQNLLFRFHEGLLHRDVMLFPSTLHFSLWMELSCYDKTVLDQSKEDPLVFRVPEVMF